MKLATYLQNGKEKWGFLLQGPDGEYICSPQDVEDNLYQIKKTGTCFRLEDMSFMPDGIWPEDIASFLALEDEGMAILRRMYDFMRHYAFEQDAFWCSRYLVPVEEAQLKAPIPRPRIYWGLVANCPTFCRLDSNRRYYNLVPQGHNRPQSCCIGTGDTMILEDTNFPLGYNVELGVIIGRRGRYVKAKDAMRYVAGYTNIIDMEVKDYFHEYDPEDTVSEDRRTEKDFFLAATASWGGKKTDCRGPMGPYLVTKDEIINPYDLICYTRQNGIRRDRCWTGALMLGIERAIEYYTSFATIYPGDVLHMGTMGIDGLGLNESVIPAPGDTLEVEIEKLGRLSVQICRAGKYDWRTSADPFNERYPAPSVREAVMAGKGECDAFSLKETRNFIICFGNYKTCMEEEGLIPVLDIPRFLNNPVSALTVDGGTEAAMRMTEADVSMELAFVVKKVASKVSEEEAEDYILGYSPMVSFLDNSLYDELNKPATPQEAGLTKSVYSRWGDGYNMISAEVVKKREDEVYGRRMRMEIAGAGCITADTGDYLVAARRILSVISRHTTLMPNDVITLGRIGKLLHLDAEQIQNGVTGSVSIDGVGEFGFSFGKGEWKGAAGYESK